MGPFSTWVMMMMMMDEFPLAWRKS